MPLDHSTVRDIVNAHIKKMRWALQLQDWRIDVSYGPLTEGTRGECQLQIGHKKAAIRIDNDKCDDEHMVLQTLRHELLHLFDAEMELYRNAIRHLLANETFDAVDELFLHAAERLVGSLERMLDHGLKIGVREMCKIGGSAGESSGQDG